MPACPSCAHDNRPGSLLCEECGTVLLSSAAFAGGTKKVDMSNVDPWSGNGSPWVEPHEPLFLHIQGATKPIVLQPSHSSFILGRSREGQRLQPDIDFTPYQGYAKGVSSVHATLRREGGYVTLEDMGSANGTYINGEPLVPGQQFTLRDGDEVRFGGLVTYIHFG